MLLSNQNNFSSKLEIVTFPLLQWTNSIFKSKSWSSINGVSYLLAIGRKDDLREYVWNPNYIHRDRCSSNEKEYEMHLRVLTHSRKSWSLVIIREAEASK